MASLEICCFTLEAALLASRSGAQRIELCINRSVGGTTPPLSWLQTLRSSRPPSTPSIPIHVMIRPRGGNFVYSADEFQTMLDQIDRYKPFVHGFVFGVLTERGYVDRDRTADLVARAEPLPCTFHKAIDETRSILDAVDDVIGTGCRAILTSGGASTAIEGANMIRQMVERAAGRTEVVVGGSVRSSNLSELANKTQAVWFHSSAIREMDDGPTGDEIERLRAVLDDHYRT